MKFNNVEEAIKTITESHKKTKKAMEMGDFKTNNKIVSKEMNPAFKYILNNNHAKSLIPLLKNNDLDLVIIIARRLLPHYEEIAIDALNNIIEKNTPHKCDVAEIVLKEWKGISL